MLDLVKVKLITDYSSIPFNLPTLLFPKGIPREFLISYLPHFLCLKKERLRGLLGNFRESA